jgi:hypothetical protein
MTTLSRLLIIFLIVGFDCAPQRVTAGLPGYFEWVLWKQVEGESPSAPHETGAKLEWIVGPYAKLAECEQERDRLAAVQRARQPRGTSPTAADANVIVTSDKVTIRFFCAPDTVNPRIDRRWP